MADPSGTTPLNAALTSLDNGIAEAGTVGGDVAITLDAALALRAALASRDDARLREAALALFEPMEHGSPSKPNEGHTVESYCAACVAVRSKRTQAIRRALVALGALPAIGMRSPEENR